MKRDMNMIRKHIPGWVKIIWKVCVKTPLVRGRRFLFRKKVRYYSRKLKPLKNSEKGNRCFIIGNGPSLTIKDLECLKNEHCFATNRIWQIFQKTTWRPTYYCAQDEVLLDYMWGEFEKEINQCEKIFLSGYVLRKGKKKYTSNTYLFYVNIGPFENDIPPFSENIYKQIFEGYTVLYACIQIAVYMGYKEIYLLGVDHSYFHIGDKETDGKRSYAEGLEVDMTKLNPPQLNKSQKAYEKAAQYCREHQITIKNLTRGGKLEVFERANFDEVLQKKGNKKV